MLGSLVDAANYSVIWRNAPEDWLAGLEGCGGAAPATVAGTAPAKLPFLLESDRPLPAEQGAGVAALRPRMLLAGVLYAWTELFAGADRPARAARLRWLQWLFGRFSHRAGKRTPGEMVLELARSARARHGPMVSARMLYAGRLLEAGMPARAGSSPAAADTSSLLSAALVYDVWRLLEHAEHLDVESASETIVSAYETIDPRGLAPGAAEGLDYAYAVALHLLARRKALREFFWRTASRRVHTPALRERLVRLLDDETLALGALRLRALVNITYPNYIPDDEGGAAPR